MFGAIRARAVPLGPRLPRAAGRGSRRAYPRGMPAAAAGREWPVDDPGCVAAVTALVDGDPLAMAAFGWTSGVVAGLGPATVRVGASQVGFRRRTGFAWLWLPGRWLARPAADVVLSIGLRAPADSPRWKQVVNPAPGHWMHHLELPDASALDAEVAGWLACAYEQAG